LRIGSATGRPRRSSLERISRSASPAERRWVLALTAITLEGRMIEAIRS
jgi:predicted protein tyrosine phosphatase